MVGRHVRIIVAPHTRIGTIEAARFDRDHISFLFHQDPRIKFKLPDVWIRESEMEECARPSDEEITLINNLVIRDD
jgi:hypothetical protein